MSDFVNGFVRGCKERGMTDEQVKTAAVKALELHPELKDEFEKSALWPAVIAGLAGAAIPWAIDRFSKKTDAAEPSKSGPVSTHSVWGQRIADDTPAPLKVTSGAPPQNLYAQPGMGGMAPRFWPSMSMPPGGFPGYGPTGHPGAPFGTSPFNHTVMPPVMPKYGSAADLAYDMEKDAWLPLVARAATLLPRLANSGVGRAVGRGLSGLGSIFSKAPTGGGPVAPNALQRAGSGVLNTGKTRAAQVAGQTAAQQKKIDALMATGKFANPAEAAAHLSNNAGVLRNAQNSLNVHGSFANADAAYRAAKPAPGFLRQNAGTLGITGLMMAPMFMGGGGEMPQQPMPQGPYDNFEHQASWLPPTIGPEKRAVGMPSDPSMPAGPPEPTPVPAPTKPGGAKPKAPAKAPAPVPSTAPAGAPGLMARLGSGAVRSGVQVGGAGLAGLLAGLVGKSLIRPYMDQASMPSKEDIVTPPSPFGKVALVLRGAAIGAGLGALSANPGERAEGAGRGAGIGAITGMGANLGGHMGNSMGVHMMGKDTINPRLPLEGQMARGLARTGALTTGGLGLGGLAGLLAGRALLRKKEKKAAVNPFV